MVEDNREMMIRQSGDESGQRCPDLDNLLANAESIIGHTLDSYTTKYDGLVNSLQECYDMVRNNRSELEIPDQSQRGLEAEYGAGAPEPEDEYTVDADDLI